MGKQLLSTSDLYEVATDFVNLQLQLVDAIEAMSESASITQDELNAMKEFADGRRAVEDTEITRLILRKISNFKVVMTDVKQNIVDRLPNKSKNLCGLLRSIENEIKQKAKSIEVEKI